MTDKQLLSADAAMHFYEPWMEPNWNNPHRPSSSLSKSSKQQLIPPPPRIKRPSSSSGYMRYRYFPEYNIDVSSIKSRTPSNLTHRSKSQTPSPVIRLHHHRRRQSFDDEDEEDDGQEFHRWIFNGRDDDMGNARRLLFETNTRKKYNNQSHRYSRHLSAGQNKRLDR
jgi:hypothetical protein